MNGPGNTDSEPLTQEPVAEIQKPRTQDLRLKIQYLELGIQDRKTAKKNPDPGTEIYNQGRGFIMQVMKWD